jgi:hypothetical protein
MNGDIENDFAGFTDFGNRNVLQVIFVTIPNSVSDNHYALQLYSQEGLVSLL